MKKILLLLAISLIVISSCSSVPKYSKEKLDSLANCLVQNKVKEYGAFWCPNCAKQEKMFGDSHKILRDNDVYQECDPRCIKDNTGNIPVACRGLLSKSEICLNNNISKYPTWVFPDNSKEVGVQEIDVLAKKAGCVI